MPVAIAGCLVHPIRLPDVGPEPPGESEEVGDQPGNGGDSASSPVAPAAAWFPTGVSVKHWPYNSAMDGDRAIRRSIIDIGTVTPENS